MFRGHLWSIHNIFAIRLKCLHGTFATCSLSVCYIIAIQKYGFCIAKVWFLACKKGVFTLQKYGFCFLNVMLLQIGRNVFRGWVWILHEIDVDISRTFVAFWLTVCNRMANHKQHFSNSFTTKWRSKSNRRTIFIVPPHIQLAIFLQYVCGKWRKHFLSFYAFYKH